jgi:hypothetical protein
MPTQFGPGALAGAAGRRGISLSGGKLATAGNTWLYWDGTGPPDPNRKRRPGQEAALLRLSGNKNSAILQPIPAAGQEAEVRIVGSAP